MERISGRGIERERERLGGSERFPPFCSACVQLEGVNAQSRAADDLKKKKEKEVRLLSLSPSLSTLHRRREEECVSVCVRQSTVWRKTIQKKKTGKCVIFGFVLCEVAIAEEGRR